MKNIVITGGTSGVGFAIAKEIAKEGHNIIIVGRHEYKAHIAQKKLGNNVKVAIGDLSDEAEREGVIDEIKRSFSHIDVLIHSAGVLPRNASENIYVNLLTHYYLTTRLRGLLANSRVLIITGHPQAVNLVPICEIQSSAFSRAAWVITHKTLLMILLNQMLRDCNTTVNSFYPGQVNSNLMRYTKKIDNTEVPVGAYLALNATLEKMSGIFFDENGKIVQLDNKKYNLKTAEEILAPYLSKITTY
ncbi:SDR family NAD(P)-dependent oxidoreductase [Leuconostoc mesenteroides]|uniref:SDR family NAD(P)-dependent oxidoreductase n=1 Tax=Leuconostoc mesenteroides TaxID=1245 RepID=UPI000BA6B081|nr:SDR family NAD(P)-dependent oxidoreductase [Leuconostoc mesenteroides]MBZ1516312.1 SDR family NAD(P)-dependent oxidoreductase [Leuconostoc mesenteroides]MBZ1540860.1 SDR family NAD(P)-dependent oxidoreductase [Leuconostoc mesenteroides]PAK80485.1 short-chain dehydrogenase [Leuconostoc mesenteroides]HBO55428.1 KR domain-containing protein [Leuconostoc mesenteroides]